MRSTPSRRSAQRHSAKAQSTGRPMLEPLELRCLMAATVTSAIADLLAHPANPSGDSIDLSTRLNDPTIPGTVARFQTTFGEIDIALTDQLTPRTVANFLSYINKGRYDNTIFSRSAKDFVQQLGGYKLTDLRNHIPVDPPIPSEFNSANPVHNVRGTVAMALSGGSNNTATSEFFFSVADNSANLDVQSGGFTVFGRVIGGGMTIVDRIAALPIGNLARNTGSSALNTVPLRNYPRKGKPPIFARNLVLVNRATAEPGGVYTVTSDDPSLVQPTVVNGTSLQFSYGSGRTGVANITVSLRSFDGSIASDTFAVTVPAASGGLLANDDAPANVLTGAASVLRPLANDTDSASAINPSTLSITQQPAHGVATINTATGAISYTPTTGFIGADTIQYTVKNASNQTSSAATIALNVLAAPVQVTIGTAVARTLSYIELDGTRVKVAIGGGTARVTFAGANVTTSTAGGVVSATGADATISDITITNAASASAVLNITASGGADGQAAVGGITASGAVAAINASNARLAGSLNVGSLGSLTLAAADHATLRIGAGRATTLVIGAASDTSIVSASVISAIRSRQWLNTDGAQDSISAPSVGLLQVTGDFAPSLQLTSASAVGLRAALIGGNLTAGAWRIAGNVGAVTARAVAAGFTFFAANADALSFRGDVAGAFTIGNRLGSLLTSGPLSAGSLTVRGAVARISAVSAAAGWSLTAGDVGALRFSGDVASPITAASIGGLQVGGNLSSTIRTVNAFAAGVVQLGRVSVAGAISGAKIVAIGNVGPIAARSIANSFIFAGVNTVTSSTNALPDSLSAIAAAAGIASITLSNGTTATPAFFNTRIAADTIGPMRLGVIQNENGGTLHGLSARKMRILTGTLAAGAALALGPAQLSNNGTLLSFIASQQIELKDFQIKLLA